MVRNCIANLPPNSLYLSLERVRHLLRLPALVCVLSSPPQVIMTRYRQLVKRLNHHRWGKPISAVKLCFPHVQGPCGSNNYATLPAPFQHNTVVACVCVCVRNQETIWSGNHKSIIELALRQRERPWDRGPGSFPSSILLQTWADGSFAPFGLDKFWNQLHQLLCHPFRVGRPLSVGAISLALHKLEASHPHLRLHRFVGLKFSSIAVAASVLPSRKTSATLNSPLCCRVSSIASSCIPALSPKVPRNGSIARDPSLT